MRSTCKTKNIIEDDTVKSLIHSWNHFYMNFPEKSEESNAPYYVPNGFVELIFLKDLHVYEAKFNEPFRLLPEAFIWGQTRHGNQVLVRGTGSWFEIKLYPWAFELLFSHPASSLPSEGLAITALDKRLELLLENIANTNHPTQAIQVFEQFAIQRLASLKKVQPFLIHAFDLMMNSHGQMKVSTLCNKMNVSRQYFHQYFTEKVGLPPKTYAKIIRLRYAVDMIYRHKNRSQTQIALDAGYFDQAHFINDFKSVLHQPPSSFFDQQQFIYWDI